MLPKLMLSDNGILYSFAVFTIKSIASISRVVLGKEFSVAVAIFTITNLLFVAIPRLLLTAASSGSGKTMITCGILKALKNRGLNCAAFKCGPDYIDPMFHRKVLGIDSYNLDTFMCKRTGVRQSLLSHGKNRDICVLEGVMGYYDGIAGISKEASAWDVADTTDTPAILILDCKGVSVSAVAVVKGFLEYETEHHIKGVILNRISPMMYARMKSAYMDMFRLYQNVFWKADIWVCRFRKK